MFKFTEAASRVLGFFLKVELVGEDFFEILKADDSSLEALVKRLVVRNAYIENPAELKARKRPAEELEQDFASVKIA